MAGAHAEFMGPILKEMKEGHHLPPDERVALMDVARRGDAFKALVASDGWRAFELHLRAHRAVLVEQMIVEETEGPLRRLQARVQELDEVLRLVPNAIATGQRAADRVSEDIARIGVDGNE